MSEANWLGERRYREAERSVLGTLVDVVRADRVVMQDSWSGYAPASPTCVVYELRRTRTGGLAGTGTFTAPGQRPRRARIAVPPGPARVFLAKLAAAEIVETAYMPRRVRTDDYPSLDLMLQVPVREHGDRGGCVLLHSGSQGDGHAPWAASLEGRTYVVAGDVVGPALRALARPLRASELRRTR